MGVFKNRKKPSSFTHAMPKKPRRLKKLTAAQKRAQMKKWKARGA